MKYQSNGKVIARRVCLWNLIVISSRRCTQQSLLCPAINSFPAMQTTTRALHRWQPYAAQTRARDTTGQRQSSFAFAACRCCCKVKSVLAAPLELWHSLLLCHWWALNDKTCVFATCVHVSGQVFTTSHKKKKLWNETKRLTANSYGYIAKEKLPLGLVVAKWGILLTFTSRWKELVFSVPKLQCSCYVTETFVFWRFLNFSSTLLKDWNCSMERIKKKK